MGSAAAACGDDNDSPAIEEPAGGDETSGDATTTTVSSPEGGGNAITIKLIAFKPTELTVPAGSAVTWVQDDVATHTVTSGTVEGTGSTVAATPDGTFDSGNIGPGQNFEFTFAAPGDVPFFCAIHPATMTGVIHVQ